MPVAQGRVAGGKVGAMTDARFLTWLAAAASALPAPVFAQAGAQAESAVPLTAFAVVAVAGAMFVAVVAIGLALFAMLSTRGRARRAAARVAELERVLAALSAELESSPTGRLVWAAGSGLETCSRSLARMLGAPAMSANTLADLAPYFAPGEFAVLDEDSRALRAAGTPFDLALRTAEDRVLLARGRTVGDPGAGAGSHVIWFDDVTYFRDEMAALRDEATAAIRQRDRLQEILDRAPFPAWQRRADLSIVWVNQAYATAVESDIATVVETGIEFVPGSGPQQTRSLAQMAVQTGAQQSDQRRFAAGGDRRTYDILEIPLAGGETVGIARDITGREDAMNELRRHTDAHADVMNRLPSAIAIFGPDKRLRFFNEAFSRLWRLDEDWLDTHPGHGEILESLREARRIPEQADFPAYKASVIELYSSVLEPTEEQEHLPDGRTLRVVTAPHPFGGLLFIFDDVSDRLELERSRNTLAAVQRATLDHLFEGVAVFGADGRLKLFNRVYAAMWRLDESFLRTEPHVSDVAERCRDLFHHGGDRDDWPTVKQKIVHRALDRTAHMERLRRPDGVVLEVASVPLPDGNTLYTYFDVSDGIRLVRPEPGAPVSGG
ncbi:MAG: PAS-domain containing protein [Proteobacteria bacterium]|nr:PAS-domain containing protein [Pseudomonadota bacterium]